MKGFNTKINANNKQRTMFLKHTGTKRHAWNWALDLCIKYLDEGKKIPSAITLHKLLVKDVKSKNEWYYESSKWTPQQALRDLEKAFERFWKIHHPKNKNLPINKKYRKKFIKQKRDGDIDELSFKHEKGFPQFKRKSAKEDSFYLEFNGHAKVVANKIKLPTIGWIKTYEYLPEVTEIKNVTISRNADDWFIGFISDRKPKFKKNKSKSEIGVDLGIKTLATISNGKNFESPKAFKKNEKKLARLQCKSSRQYEVAKKIQEGKDKITKSNNNKKTDKKIAKLHQKISNIRLDCTHKLTSNLSKNHRQITIEGLNVSGMMKNRHLASAISDGGFFEFKRQLIYKCEWRGVNLIIVDKWFPSSQLCSCCGHKQKMPLKKRIFDCENCKTKIDRDLNASINLRDYEIKWKHIYEKNTPSYGEIQACGDAKVQDESLVSVNEAGIRQRIENSNVQICVGS